MSHSENLRKVKKQDKNDPFNKFCFKKSTQALKE